MDSKIYNKLTSSAQEALNQITEELKCKVLEQAYDNARLNNTSDIEISLSDILKAKEKLFDERVKKDFVEYKKKKFIYLVGISGLIYAIIGLFIYVFQNKEFDLSSDIGLIIAAFGFLTSFFAFFYQQLLKGFFTSVKPMSNLILNVNIDDFDIVKKWQMIEQMTRTLMIQNGINDNKSNSFNSILNFLDGVVDSDEKKNKLRELLKIRNIVLHDNFKLDKSYKSELNKFSDEIIDLLDKRLK